MYREIINVCKNQDEVLLILPILSDVSEDSCELI